MPVTAENARRRLGQTPHHPVSPHTMGGSVTPPKSLVCPQPPRELRMRDEGWLENPREPPPRPFRHETPSSMHAGVSHAVCSLSRQEQRTRANFCESYRAIPMRSDRLMTARHTLRLHVAGHPSGRRTRGRPPTLVFLSNRPLHRCLCLRRRSILQLDQARHMAVASTLPGRRGMPRTSPRTRRTSLRRRLQRQRSLPTMALISRLRPPGRSLSSRRLQQNDALVKEEGHMSLRQRRSKAC